MPQVHMTRGDLRMELLNLLGSELRIEFCGAHGRQVSNVELLLLTTLGQLCIRAHQLFQSGHFALAEVGDVLLDARFNELHLLLIVYLGTRLGLDLLYRLGPSLSHLRLHFHLKVF